MLADFAWAGRRHTHPGDLCAGFQGGLPSVLGPEGKACRRRAAAHVPGGAQSVLPGLRASRASSLRATGRWSALVIRSWLNCWRANMRGERIILT